MPRFALSLVALAALSTGLVAVAAAPLAAQTTAPAAPAEGVGSVAEAVAQAPAPYVAATHGDWEVLCQPVDAELENCEMYQLLQDESQQPVAEISIAALPFGAEFAAGATVTTPLETFLPTGLGFRIGEEETMRVEQFRVCTVIGCVVRMGLTAEEIEKLKAGSVANFLIAPFIAIDQPVTITMSLTGFTAAYEDVQTRFATAAAIARTRQGG